MQKALQNIKRNEGKLEAWFQETAKSICMPLTVSVDIRNAGFKMSVIDTNVFPAGFHYLCKTFSKDATQLFKDYLKSAVPKAKRILIVPEAFTRNLPYLQNVKKLETLLLEAGFTVQIGYLESLPQNPFSQPLSDGGTIDLHQFDVKNFQPDAILLNNDCSQGIPAQLQGLKIPIFPNPELGWHARSKKNHFELYCQLVGEAAKLLDLDCWLFCPITVCEHDIDTNQEADMERIAKRVDEVIGKTQKKYDKYGITEKPFCFVKSNVGTFGLGLVKVENSQEILELNRKGRQKLGTTKGGTGRSEFIIQEGIPTRDTLHGSPVEPVLYYVGGEWVGGFFRIHEDKDDRSSLNSPGAKFETLCFHKSDKPKEIALNLNSQEFKDYLLMAQWLGKIACLAVGLEEKGLINS
ncbi:MAG: glutamate--cysteine ligase [Deltaproteobacteria bacterium]|nr:glutamate--cysteine ligase [Deltaproteobacteria bacterium]